MWHTVSMESTELKRLADAYHRAKKRADTLRTELFDAIRTADAEDMKQFEIVGLTGFSRDHIRKIVNPDLVKPKSKRQDS